MLDASGDGRQEVVVRPTVRLGFEGPIPGQLTTKLHAVFQFGVPGRAFDSPSEPPHAFDEPIAPQGLAPYAFGNPVYTQDHATRCPRDPFTPQEYASGAQRVSFDSRAHPHACLTAFDADWYGLHGTTCMDPTQVLGKAGGEIERDEPGRCRATA